MADHYTLLRLLADGGFHSGAALGRHLGISRTAIWKQLKALELLGIEIYAVSGKGYRLAQPLELLDHALLTSTLSAEARRWLSAVELHSSLDSTNSYVLKQAMSQASGFVCLAERQESGRGRRGRTWLSPFGCNIYLSLLWRFPHSASFISGLSLAAGVMVARALQDCGLSQPELKWPNDILAQGRKLGGILIDVVGEAAGPCTVVLGVGINLRMARDPQTTALIDQAWINLEEVVGAQVPRNHLAGRLIEHLLLGLARYEQAGLPAFITEWRCLDTMMGKPVQVRLPQNVVQGMALGVDEAGALLIENNGVTQRYHSGEVSLRYV